MNLRKLFATIVASHEKGLTVTDHSALSRANVTLVMPTASPLPINSMLKREDYQPAIPTTAFDAGARYPVYGELLASQRRLDLLWHGTWLSGQTSEMIMKRWGDPHVFLYLGVLLALTAPLVIFALWKWLSSEADGQKSSVCARPLRLSRMGLLGPG